MATTRTHAFTYRTLTYSGGPSQTTSAYTRTMWTYLAEHDQSHPTTPHTQPLPGITRTRFSLIRYRSPLHTESQLFSSPTGTEMFHFPASTPTQAMHSPAGNHTSLRPGFPIRTSSDQRFVGNSPRHNAASHVLHRLSMPRHPPYALKKHTKHKKKHTTHARTHPHHPKKRRSRHTRACINARVHSPVLTHHTHTQPPTQHEQPHAGHTEHTQTNLVSAPQTPNSMPAKQQQFSVAHPPARNAGTISPAGASPPGFLHNGSSCTHGNINHHTQPPTNTKRPCTTKTP